jgi:putative thiamine transport system substrate-binding protein
MNIPFKSKNDAFIQKGVSMVWHRREVLGLLGASFAFPVLGARAEPEAWSQILEKARGQVVYFHAWGGEQRINDYIAWASDECEKRFGVRIQQVKLADTADAVSRIIAEAQAGNRDQGSVDLIWINGANFASLKEKGLLYGPFAEDLPNFQYVDPVAKPVVVNDFTVSVEGYEVPWGLAQLVFFGDQAVVADFPRNAQQWLQHAKDHPGRVTYVDPNNYLGASFLKQILLELTIDANVLSKPPVDFEKVTEPLWLYLDALHPVSWRQARVLPQTGAELRQLVADAQVDFGIAFDPAEASASIAKKDLPESVRSFVFEKGMIGNAHFTAIPFNAAHREAAMVAANFLLSPLAQAHKQDPKIWGSFTVLEMNRLKPEDKARFDAIDLGIATLSPEALGPALSEPHGDWMLRIVEEWTKRYRAG